MIDDQIQVNKFSKYKYHDPREVLLEFRFLEELTVNSQVDEKVKSLRTTKLKKHREGREAALFCHGLGKAMKQTVFFSPAEDSDYDFVTCWKESDSIVFTPVQLKEVTSDTVNQECTVDPVLTSLSKYEGKSNLVIAVHLNKRGQFNFNTIEVPKLNIAQLWLFGALSPDQSQWFIYGDMLSIPDFYKFSYPH